MNTKWNIKLTGLVLVLFVGLLAPLSPTLYTEANTQVLTCTAGEDTICDETHTDVNNALSTEGNTVVELQAAGGESFSFNGTISVPSGLTLNCNSNTISSSANPAIELNGTARLQNCSINQNIQVMCTDNSGSCTEGADQINDAIDSIQTNKTVQLTDVESTKYELGSVVTIDTNKTLDCDSADLSTATANALTMEQNSSLKSCILDTTAEVAPILVNGTGVTIGGSGNGNTLKGYNDAWIITSAQNDLTVSHNGFSAGTGASYYKAISSSGTGATFTSNTMTGAITTGINISGGDATLNSNSLTSDGSGKGITISNTGQATIGTDATWGNKNTLSNLATAIEIDSTADAANTTITYNDLSTGNTLAIDNNDADGSLSAIKNLYYDQSSGLDNTDPGVTKIEYEANGYVTYAPWCANNSNTNDCSATTYDIGLDLTSNTTEDSKYGSSQLSKALDDATATDTLNFYNERSYNNKTLNFSNSEDVVTLNGDGNNDDTIDAIFTGTLAINNTTILDKVQLDSETTVNGASTIKNSDINNTVDIKSTGVNIGTTGNGNSFVLTDTNTGITSSGTGPYATVSIVDNTFKAATLGQSYNGIDLGTQFTNGALTLTNNDMSAETNDVILTGIKVASGTATITQSTIDSDSTGLAIDIDGGTGHTIGGAWADKNVFIDLDKAVDIANAVDATGLEITFNDFETGVDKAVVNHTVDENVNAIKNNFGSATDPIAKFNDNTAITYAPWCASAANCGSDTFAYDIINETQNPDLHYGAAQYVRALSEAAVNDTVTFDNHTSALTSIPVDTANITINGSDNTTFDQALTVSAQVTLDDAIFTNTINLAAAGITLRGSDIRNTVTLNANNLTIGIDGDRNTFKTAGGNTAIQSDTGATDILSGLNISYNDFISSNNTAYTGIDLGDDFADQTMQITNNSLTGPITTGISVASGTPTLTDNNFPSGTITTGIYLNTNKEFTLTNNDITGTIGTGIHVLQGTVTIKQSDITSAGNAGKGIVLSGSGTYTLGADGIDADANTLELLATGIELNTAQTVNIYNNFIGTDGNQNTKGIHTVTTNDGTATLKNNHFDNTTSIHLAANTTLNSTDDTIANSTTGIQIDAVDKTITITGLTSENTNTIGILKNDTPDGLSVLDIKGSTFNLVDGATGIKLANGSINDNTKFLLNNDNSSRNKFIDTGDGTKIAIDNLDGTTVVAAFNWFNDASGPYDDYDSQGGNVKVQGLVQYSQFYTHASNNTLDYRIKSNDGSTDRYHTLLSEAEAVTGVSSIELKRNITASMDAGSKDLNTNATVSCDSTAREIQTELTISGEGTLSTCTIKNTVSVESSNVTISGNTFTMTGADTAITSPNNNANNFTGLEILNNSFSGNGTYYGIDLKDDFGTNAISLTNNDMTGVLNTGIKLASGLATIKNSDISSDGTGIGIHLVGGGDHEIGADGNTGVKNVLKSLATAISHDANLHAKVYANDIGTADDGNSVGILSTTNAITSKGNTYRSTPLAIDIDGDVDLTSNGDTFHDATTAAIDLDNAAATADVDDVTIENSCTIGILATRNSTINVAGSTFNLAAGDKGLFADTTATGTSITMLDNKFLQNTEDADSELAIDNDSGSKITATYNWFSHATGPRHIGVDITDISGIQIDGLIEFSPFYDSVNLAEGGIDFRLKATDTNNDETYHTYLDTAQAVVNLSQLDIQRTFQLLNNIELTANNTNYICSNQQTILDPVGDNEVVLSGAGSTITNCKIDDNLKITGNSSGISGTTVTGNILLNGTNNFIMGGSTIEGTTAINNTGADLKGSTFKGTVTISNSNAKIGKNGGNTFTMTGADTAITSPGTNNAFTGLEIIDNTFSGDGSYIGIDLKDDFGNPAQGDAQAITLTNNDMTGILDTGIKIASGVATIKNSDISSDGTGVGILLTDGGDHVLGVDGDNAFKNVLKNLTTGLQVSIAGQDINVYNSEFGANTTPNTTGLLVDPATTTTVTSKGNTYNYNTKAIRVTEDATFESNGDIISNSTTAGIEINHADANPTITGLTSNNTNPIGVLITLSDTGSIQNSTFNMDGSDTGIKLIADADKITVTKNIFDGAGADEVAIDNDDAATLAAHKNYFDAADGPIHDDDTATGSGDKVQGKVQYSPFYNSNQLDDEETDYRLKVTTSTPDTIYHTYFADALNETDATRINVKRNVSGDHDIDVAGLEVICDNQDEVFSGKITISANGDSQADPVLLQNCTLSDQLIITGSFAKVDNNIFNHDHATDYTIVSTGATVDGTNIINNTFNSANAINLTNSDNAESDIEGNTFNQVEKAINTSNKNIIIHNNEFKVDTDLEAGSFAINSGADGVEQNTVTITSNTIETAGDAAHDFEKAIIIGHANQTSLATLTITGNTIKDSDTGIELLKSPSSAHTISTNLFYDSIDGTRLINTTGSIITAYQNWWGTTINDSDPASLVNSHTNINYGNWCTTSACDAYNSDIFVDLAGNGGGNDRYYGRSQVQRAFDETDEQATITLDGSDYALDSISADSDDLTVTCTEVGGGGFSNFTNALTINGSNVDFTNCKFASTVAVEDINSSFTNGSITGIATVNADSTTFDSVDLASNLVANNQVTIQNSTDITGTLTLNGANSTVDASTLNSTTAVGATGITIQNSTIKATVDIAGNNVDINTNDFILNDTDTGITSSGAAASLATASIVDNTFRANVEEESYTGIDLGDQFTGAITLTNNDMSTATNDEITIGIQLTSGTATITGSNLFSNNDTGIGINVLGGNHTLGADDSDFNTLDDFATGVKVALGATVNGSYNKFESNTKDIDNDEVSFIEIFKSWFGHAEGPEDDTGQGSGGVVEGKVEYSPFLNTSDLSNVKDENGDILANKLDGVIVIKDTNDAVLGYATTLSEAMTTLTNLINNGGAPTKAELKRNFTHAREADIDFSVDGITYECTDGQTITDTNGTVVLSASNASIKNCNIDDNLQITGNNNTIDSTSIVTGTTTITDTGTDTTLSNVTLNGATSIAAANALIENSTVKATIDIAGNNASINNNVFILTDTDTGITSSGDAASLATASIVDNTFRANVEEDSYTGIDLGDQFTGAITLTNNDMSTATNDEIIIGIRVASGTATITQSTIDSDSTGLAIDIDGGSNHTIGGAWADKNVFTDLATAVDIADAVDATGLTITFNDFETGVTNAVINNTADENVNAINNNFGSANDPIAKFNNNTAITYAPWCASAANCGTNTFAYDIINTTQGDLYYGAAQYERALSEALANETVTFDNHTSALTSIPADTANITINGSDNTTFDQALTVSAQVTLDDAIFTNTINLAATGITLRGSDIRDTVTVNANNLTIGADGDRNTFKIAGGNTAIQSDTVATDTLSGLNISYNDFESSDATAYTGIDLGNDFAGQAITLTDNDMSTPLTVGIQVASGTATITKSNITSDGSGIGIRLNGGASHNIGSDGNPNVLTNLASGLTIENTLDASTLTIEYNQFATNNTLGITNNDGAIATAYKNWWGSDAEPTAEINQHLTINYGNWCTTSACEAFNSDIFVDLAGNGGGNDRYYGRTQVQRAFDETNEQATITLDGGNFALDSISADSDDLTVTCTEVGGGGFSNFTNALTINGNNVDFTNCKFASTVELTDENSSFTNGSITGIATVTVNADETTFDNVDLANNLVANGKVIIQNSTDITGTLTLNGANSSVDASTLNSTTAVGATGVTIANSTIKATVDIAGNNVDINTNDFILNDTDTGITSSGAADSLDTASIVDNTFRANVEEESYTGIDLGDQFTGAITLTNNDMSTATNDEITIGIQLASGTATITGSNLFSNNDTGIGINVLGGNHTLGADDSDFNTLDDFATGVKVALGATINGSYNKFENNTKDIDNDEVSFIEIFKSWFGHADGPTNDTEQGSGGVVEGNVEYSPFITTDDMNTDNLDGVIVIQDNTDTAIGYATTLAEAMTNIAALETAYQNDNTKPQPVKVLIKHNFTTRDADINFSENGITYECTAGQTITDTNGTVVLSASNASIKNCNIDDNLQITGNNNTIDSTSIVTGTTTITDTGTDTTLSNVTLNGATSIAAANALIENSTVKATIDIAGNNASINNNVFILTDTDTGITSSGDAASLVTASIVDNTFRANVEEESYTGIDLGNQFTGALTLTNNDMSTATNDEIIIGIRVASGTATITNSEIDSTGVAGTGININGGASHVIGTTGNTNTLTDLASAITIENTVDASTLTIAFNKLASNTKSITNNDDAIATAYKNWWGSDSEPNTLVNNISKVNYGNWCTTVACDAFNSDIFVDLGNNASNDRFYGRLQVERAFDETVATATITLDGGNFALDSISADSDDLTVTCTEVGNPGNFSNFTSALTVAGSNVDFTNCKFADTVAVNDVNSSFTNGSITGIATVNANETTFDSVDLASNLVANNKVIIQNSTDITGTLTLNGANSSVDNSTLNSTTAVGATGITIQNSTIKATVDIAGNNVDINTNDFILNDTDTGITSSGDAGSIATASIVDNTFRANVEEESYTGIDLGNQFTGALTLTNNDISTATNDEITIGIRVASGTATITNSEITSNGTGTGISLNGGASHVIGSDGNPNILTNLASGLTIEDTVDASTLTIEFNQFAANNTKSITNNDDAIATAYKNWWGSDAEPNTLVNNISKVNYGNWCTTVACDAFNSDIFVDLGNNASNDRFYGRLQVERAFDETVATATITLDGGNFALDSISADSDDLTVTCTEVGNPGNFSNFTSALTVAGSNVDFTNCKFADTVAVNDVNSSFTNGSITGIATVNANETTFDSVDLASNLVANNKVIIQNSTDITGTLTLNGANSSVDNSTLNSTTAVGATGITIQNSTIKATVDIAGNNVDINTNDFILNDTDTGITSSGAADSLATASIVDNTFRANVEGQSYTGIDLGDQFTGALTLTNNDMSTATNDVITFGIQLASGTATITGSNLFSNNDTGIGINVLNGNHILGNIDSDFNTLDDFATGVKVALGATVNGSYNKFENNTKDIDNDEVSFIEIFKSWFGAADGPTNDTGQGSGGVVEGNVEYSPFITSDNMDKTNLDGVIVIKAANGDVLGYATTLSEAMTTLTTIIGNGGTPTKAEIKHNFTTRDADIDFSVNGITYECTAGQTITDTNGTVELSASNATITGCTIDDDLEITGANNTISNNTLKATVTIAGNNTSINTNTFQLANADTGITSSGAAASLDTASIVDNTFRANVEGQSYTGIDLRNQFTGALTLTNNDMSTATNDVITTGITIGSGTATITKSDLRSKSRQGVAIRLYGGTNHILGTADIANRNTIANFQTGLETKYTANIISAIENKFTNTNTAVNNVTNNLLTITNSYFDAVDGPQDDSGYGTTGARVVGNGNNPDLVNYSPFYTDPDMTTFDARFIIKDNLDVSIGHASTYNQAISKIAELAGDNPTKLIIKANVSQGDTIDIDNTNMTFECSAQATTIDAGDSVININASGFTFNNCTINDQVNIKNTGVSVTNSILPNIEVTHANAIIANNTLNSTTTENIYLKDATLTTILDNVFSGNTTTAIKSYGTSATLNGNNITGDYAINIHTVASDLNADPQTITLGNANILESATPATGIGIKAEDALTHINIDSNYGTETVINQKATGIENKNARLTISKAQITNNIAGVKNLSTNSQDVSIQKTVFEDNTKAIHNLGTSDITIQRNILKHNAPAFKTTFAIDNEQSSIIALQANCISQLYSNKGLVQIKTQIDDCTKNIQQIEVADTVEPTFVSQEKEGLAEVATDKIIIDETNPEVNFLKEENTKAVVGNTFTTDSGQAIDLTNVTVTNSDGSKTKTNVENIEVLGKKLEITKAIEFKVNEGVILENNNLEIQNTEDLDLKLEIPQDTIIFAEEAYDGFKFDKIAERSGAFKALIDEANIVKLGSDRSQLVFNKPIEVCFDNNTGEFWGIQNQPGERFFPIDSCSGSTLSKGQNECFYKKATATCIVTNHASVVAQANQAIPPLKAAGQTEISDSGASRKTFSNQTSDKQLKLNVEKMTTFEEYRDDKIIIKNVSKDKFAETSLPSQIVKTFEIGKRALETNKDLRVTYIVPDKYKDQTQDLALYQYDLTDKVYKLLDASPSLDENKAYFNTNTSGTMAILVTNYKRDELRSVESIFDTQEIEDLSIPWYVPFMRKAQSLNVINQADEPLTQVTRAKLSDMITKLLDVEIAEDAQNPFSDITESTIYSESILTLKKLGIIKGYSDGTFKPQNNVTRAEALKIILLTAGIPESMEQSIFKDVDNEQWFTKFVMAANKLGIVRGYADGEFKPQKTITISEMTKILIKVKEMKQNSLVSQNDLTKIQEIFSFFTR